MEMEKAQGSLEYLILIGWAALVGIILILLVLSTADTGTRTVRSNVDVLSDYQNAVQGCPEGGFEINREIILLNAGENITTQPIEIPNDAIVGSVILRPRQHADQDYTVSINAGTQHGPLGDTISNIEPLEFANLNESVSTSFTLTVQRTGTLQVVVDATIILCE